MLEDKLSLSSRSFLGHFKHYSINIPVKILSKAETKILKKSEKQFCNSFLLQNVVIQSGVFDAYIQIDELIQTL